MNKTKKVQNVYKLTPMQQGMLFHSLANPYSSAYFEQTSVDIEGVFHIDLFEQSINQLIERHDILRTVFSTSIREQILQIVWQHQPLPVQVEDLQTMSKEEQKTYIDTFKKEDRLKGFNLSRGPLMRIAVLQKGETSFHLVWSFHHILMDGWCVPLIYKEAFYIYQQLVENNTILLPEAPPYKRYIEWLEKQDQQQADDYWNAYLAGYEQQVSLIKSEQKMTEGYRSSKEGFELGAERTARLHALSKRYQVTLNTLLQTIWGVVLQRYNNCNDIVFGGVVSGRPAEIRGVEEMLGLFINTIPIRIMSKDNESFEQCVQRVQRDSLESAQYDFYPLYEIQARTALKQELVNHIMVFENYPVDQQIKEMSNNAQSPYSFHNVEVFEQTSYDLNLIIAPGNSLQIAFHYNELVYDQQTIEQIMGHLTSVMDQIISQPDLRIQELKLLTQPEIEQILYDFNKTEEAYPREKSIAELFEEQVRVTPHQEAVIFGEKALSYEELNRRANQLARKLCRNGVQPDTIVGILMDRSLEMIIGIMGVLKAGGAYLPLDPSYPTERIQYMLQDSGVDIVLSQHRITHLIDSLEFQGEVLLLDQFEYEGEEESNLEPQAGAEDLAYLIYTSGSTGQPKGVMIEHRGVVNLLQTQKKAFDLGPESRVLQFASFSFDASVWEIFMSLLTGASLYLEEQDRLLPGPSFIRLVREKRITTLTLPPAALALLPEEELPDLQTLIVAGEACSGDLARRWARGRRFFNAYGPTEGTVCASMALCTEELVGNPSIGRPILNKQILIVSENGHLQPIGVAGELCIAGEGLARGYLNKPDITKERFVTHPYDPQKQMYRTGDIARWLPDGSIEYLGRMDHQVKIRGYRIELGEIESKLLKNEAIQEAIVVATADEEGQKSLCAYFTSTREEDIPMLKQDLTAYLPDYMIPSYFVQVEQMPLTPNGKIDRKALPKPIDHIHSSHVYEEPRNETEAKLLHIWKQTLGIAEEKSIGIHDNFFDLGGHSLKATTLVSKIQRDFEVSIMIKDIFTYPTVQKMAERIQHSEVMLYSSIQKVDKQPYYPVSSAQKRIYALSNLEGGDRNYNMPGAILIEGNLDKSRLHDVLQKLVGRHESLRTSFEIKDGEPVQFIHSSIECEIEYLEYPMTVQAKMDEAQAQQMQALFDRFVKAFVLEQAPLFRVCLVKVNHNQHILLFDMHHIISDGATMGILIKEFSALYKGAELPELSLQYKDYAVWQSTLFRSDQIKKQEEYWLKQLGEDLPVLNMPTDYPRPSIQSFEGKSLFFTLEKTVTDKLKFMGRETGTSLYMILLSAYTILLSKYTNQEDIVVGSPIAGRAHADLEPLIGMFVNTLAMRNQPQAGKTFRQYLLEVKENALQAFENQTYPFEQIVEKLGVTRDLSRNPIFDTVFVLQSQDVAKVDVDELRLEPIILDHKTSKFDITLNAAEGDKGLIFNLEYSTKLFKEETMLRFFQHYRNVLQQILEFPDHKLSDMEILSELEREELLYRFNATERDYPSELSLAERFEAQVTLTPDHVALVFGEQKLSYQELNEKASQVARKLRQHDVQPNSVVGIMAERSPEMIIGILGIVKAGGAYLPLDPHYPVERIQYMVADAGVNLLLTQEQIKEQIMFQGEEITLSKILSAEGELKEQAGKAEQSTEHVETSYSSAEDVAYIIYTSGSTGKPKGVMATQRGVMRLVCNPDYVELKAGDSLLQTGALVFDASTFEIWGALLNGLTLVLVEDEVILDAGLLEEALNRHQITTMWLTSPLFNQLSQKKPSLFQPLKQLIVGGDVLSPPHIEAVRKECPDLRLINGYGPTENTTFSCCYTIEGEIKGSSIPIGHPIANSTAYVLNQENQLQPILVAGELCVGGAGVAKGYINQPELTAEKFIDHPFCKGEKLYRTGDLARWLPDGTLEYLGRMDHQVKIRGYRIELGEIQNHLVQLEGIEEAFVTVREEQDGHKALCAYFSAAQAVDLTEIREQLSKELPSYMVPAYFVQVEQMPLTANGKVDRKALPDPSESMQLGTELVAPRNEAEEVLVRIWQDVLGAKQIGIKHHFFELGGDSIKAIQVASRLNQAGYKLEIKDLFKHPRIADLSALLQPLTIRSEQGVVQGDVFLTPIQKWFFEQQFAEQHHWNQSVMLARKEGFDEKLIRQVFQRITEHHDALRMVFRSVEDEWRGWNRGLDDGAVFDLEVFDVTREPAQEEELKTFIEQKVNEIQRSIDLSTGPLVKLGLFHTPAGDHLLIVIHHLVVDGLSWRILFEDIATAYGQASTGSDIALPAKTDSVQYWSAQLQAYASHAELQKERAYWQAIEANSKDIQLPRDFISSELSLVKDCQQVSISLDQVETQQLLREANKAFNTEINDLLLTALGLTIAEWSKSEQIVIHLEGHGREPIVKDMDINRTVGWFTTQYPVLLELSDEELDQQIIRVKERLHQIPNKGIGYGILTYLSDSFEQLDDRTPSDVKKPEISFNYLGQFDQDLPASNISMSMYSSGTSMSPRSQSLAHLNVNGLVVNQELHMTFDYSTKEYKHETIERLAQQFKKHLLNMMMYCLKQEKTTFTPCDMVYQKLTLEQFNALRQEVSKVGNLENLYPLSPMQQGMFFHTQADPDSVVYFEQISFDIEGDFEPSLFERSVQYLMERHEILRTVFSIYFDQPLQIVLEDQQLAFTYQNLIELNSADQKRSMNEYKALDRVRGFELSQGPLIRIALFQTDSKQFHLLWSFHHILMDGWCIPILLREVCQVYQLLLEDEPLSLPHIAPYSDYIEWLTEQNRQEAIEYWKKYLADYEQRVDLPLKKQKQGNEYVLEHLEFSLGEEMTAKLNQMARTHKVTINILLQTAWGVLLQKYNHCQDVVFGSVVSGRPSEIQGIEEMLGLFINTIPVRIRVSEGDTFEQSVLRNQEHALNSAAYDFYPLYDIQSETGVHRDFVNHLMVFENYPVDQQLGQMEEFYQLPFQMSNIEAFEQTNYDFNLVIIPGNSIQVRFKYNARVYEQENMNRIQTHFLHVLQQVLSQPSIEVGDVAILTETEKEKLYVALNDTQTNYPKDKTLHQLFEEQVELTPENIAIEYEKQVITYRELNNIANQMALVLREKGVQRNDIVAVLFDRSIEMMVSLLAILKAGGAYMPIDPNYPEERISYMLDDSQAKWMVTTRKRASVCSTKITLLIVEDMLLNKREMTSNPPHINVSSDLANVIYTSGSTGKPKGSLISHFNVSRVVLNTNYIQITEGDHILHLLNYAFDGSTFDIYGALLNGATLVLVLHDTVLDHKKLAQLIALKDQAILLMTTSLFNTFVDMAPEGLSHAKKILVGGEKVSVAHMKKAWQFTGPNVLINVYGPTESTVFATTHPINDIASDALSIPIGKPISNTEVFIVDPQGALLPIGIPGELCLAGDGLAQGYLNNPALTAERFISHPFEPEKRMYRTGDRARYLPDGTIDYIERMDQQVKIRGYRIELGEIEAQLLKMKELNQATVVVRGEQEGQKYLAAYITSDRDLDIAKIREELAKSLPSYMIPAYMIQLDELPLTRNGKLDQKALPEPTNMLQSTDYVAPRNEGEEKLSILWREVLGLSVNNDQEQRKIGIHDHFFELGGHSLKATLLVAKIHREFQVEVQIKDVFEYPTLELMARHIAHSDTKQFSSIQPAQKKEFYSLSSAQKRIYILSMLEGGDVSYNMPGALKIEGKLDQAAFTEVCKKLISRHEAFRTSFDVVNGEPMQMIHSDVSFEVEFVQAEEEQVVSLINDFIRPFDLRTAPLFRVKLVQLAEESYVMIFDMHHVISDGTSMNILTKEFAELYAGQVLPELRIQYKDYSEWQNGWFMKEDMQRQKEFWLDMFSKQPALLNMPLDYPRPPMQSFEGKTISLTIEQELKTELQRMATETGTTLYMVLLSAYNVLLSTYTGQEDVVVGTPVAGRNHAEVMNVIGMFVNTLALRNYPEGKKTFLEFLHEVKESTLSAFEHQDYPFEELVEHLDLMRDMSRHALFDTMFSMQNSHGEGSELAGLSFRPYEMEQQVSKFDFTLHAEESSDGVELTLEYCRALFTEEKMVRFLHHFVHILHEITLNPVQRISEISVLTEAEKHTLLVEFNDTQAEYPQEVTFHALFEEQVLRTPDQVAVRLGEQCLSYKELNERANQLARALREYCIQPNEMVGIMMERSLEMVIGVMAILKAGGAYLPLDPSYPEERIQYMLANSETNMLVSHRGLTDSFAFDQKVIDIENVEMLERDITNLEPINHSSDLVYVIYTSGTTGKPKGVMIEHRSFVNVSYAWKKELKLDHKRKLLQMASFSFDVFAADLSRALLSGGELVICPEEARFDVGALYSIMKEYNINMIDLTPALAISLMKYIEEHQLDITFLDTLIIGSDACPVEDFRKIISRYGKQIRVLNCFGVTEVAVESSIYEGTLEADTLNGMVPIGKPIQNTQILIVDAYDRLQPIGVEGELCIAGDGLARGYLNKPNETKEKFVAHPYDPEKKMYRTGDLARWLEDGTIEYLGRMDQQVKIRGFRIELAEIEYTLTKYNKVQEAVVVAKKDRLGNHSLCAYVVAEDEVAIKELRDFLTQQLPDYMIPSVFINLEQMPMTPNGKIDRAWLSRSEIEGEVLTGQEYVAPRNEIEEKLVQIWSEVLGLQSSEAQRATLPVGIEDSFFELGGHSLRATSLLAKIHQGFNVSLSLKDMFRYTTIREQAELIQQSTTQLFRSIPSAAEKEFYPVSSAQKRMYVLTNLEGAELSYNMPGAVAIDGRITREGIENIFTSLVARHESLRTSFMIQEGVPVQLIHELVEFSLEYMEVHLPAIEVKQELIEGWLNGFIRPFDLTKAPLFRVKLVRIKEEKHLLLFDIHHIISDGTTMDILLQEFSALYHGQVLSPLRIQYKDYSEWQNQLFYSQEMDKQKEFWQQTFAGELPVLQLPLDYPRPPIQSFEGARIVSSINQERAEQLQHVAKETGTTLYMVLLAAYNVLLAKYSGQEEIIVGSPVAGRNHADLEHVIGMFVNTLVFRHYPQKHKTFAAFLEEVKEQALSAFENQDYPFEELLHHVELTRDISRNPLFDTMFVLQNTEMRTLELGGLKLSSVDLDLDLSRFDLTLNVMESDEGISLSLEYGTKLFRRETMERFMGHFKQILEVIVENSFVQLGDIHFLSEKETHQLLYDFNRTEEAYPREKSIAELFEEQVRVTPHQAAVIFGEQALSYEELNRRANQLARKLCRNGVQPDTIVGILMDRSLEMIIGIMGVLKAGGAYLPLDPSYPAERIQYMLQDSGVDIVLSQQRVTHLINSFEFQGEVLLLDQFEYEGEEESNLEPQAGAQDLAYLIYTSGSTGQPKGVMIEHRGVVNLLQTQKKAFDLGPESRVLQFASFSFDASVWEIFMSLLTGASLYLEEQDLLLPGPSFIRLVREKRITTLTLPPAALALLPEEELPDLQTLIVAGEACSGDLARRWARGRRFFNAYGPTEGTVCASMALCTEELVGNPSIGRPILNKQILIVSENGHLQPIGVAGELCIAGEGLARGYLNKPDITKERFVTHPYDPQKQMYRTGDIARWLPDGSIEYLGRMDHQVKIRGYRIELGEIESKLLAHQEIQEAVVEAMTYNENQQDLCAYFTATREISVFEIKQHLSVALANYMIPSHFIQVEQMPLTPNGKIDRKALMKTEQNWLRGTEYTAPRNEAEERLVQIWQRVLLIEDEERIGTTDSFFYLGGDSLKALKLIHEIKNEFEIALSIQSLFNSPTIAEIAENMSQEMSDMPTSNHEMAATQRGYISFTGVDSQNIFSFPPIFGYGVYYKELAHYLRNDATVYAFDFIEEENRIEQYVDRMIELQQEGSFIVLGHSAGGNLAFEVVQELEKRGRHVEQLILVDSSTTASIEQAALDEMEAYMDQLVAAASASKYGPLFTEEVGTALRVKIKAYLDYLSQHKTESPIQANIDHVISVQEEQGLAEDLDWSAYTKGNYRQYTGYGTHYEMLTEKTKENSEILRELIHKRKVKI